jgi:hypothetical protein
MRDRIRSSFRNLSIQVEIAAADYGWVPDEMEAFFESCGIPKSAWDAHCVRFESRWSNEEADELARSREARERKYEPICFRKYSIIGKPFVLDTIRGNGTCRDGVAVAIVHGLMNGSLPEHILFAPGIYGLGVESRVDEYWLRPVTWFELLGSAAPLIVYRLALASRRFTRGSRLRTGLFCVDRRRVPQIRELALQLLNGTMIRYVAGPDEICDLPCVCEEQLANLLNPLRTLIAEQLCGD